MSSNEMFDDYTPKKKAKSRAYSLCWNSKANIGFPGVFLFCCLFFLAGFFASNLLSQRGRRLESLDYDLMARGETGDDSVSVIPFQVISWRPRAFYFPNFATPAQCQHIIDMAKPKLEPSTVLLAKGETQQPNDVRTRVATFLLYLSDVEGGGETAFPFEDGLNMDENYDVKKCIGLKAKPRLGDGLLFYSLFPNNSIDPTSTHGSCPVIKGAKWVATKWIRDQQDF
ncbi:Oxidoreductase isoform 5 [Theobroma cacao]|uniref:Oxidoreductase isoform 5 n=1 Tax=Theobroma cacao TaxID=3641 RepID=A0A061DGY6_THECC|nr:Oxidoreductase isoform 5 [Theobroma cacao]